MRKLINLTILSVSFLFLSHSVYAQKQVEGVDIPTVIKSKTDESLNLRGVGVRTKFFFDLYVCSLFIVNPDDEISSIINSDQSISVRLNIISDMITAEKMYGAMADGFELSSPNPDEVLQEKINVFQNLFKANSIKDGDQFQFSFSKKYGTVVSKNGKDLASIPGLDFKKALFDIWLGTKPVDKGLKKELLEK
jgi:hypothetical protein